MSWLPLHAVTMVPLSIADLAAKSQLAVHGTVTSKSCQRDAAGRIYTKVNLRVTEVWKGNWTGDHLTVVHGGGILGEERVAVAGQVEYQVGEQVVAFIVFNQRGEGVTLGLAQGKFYVQKDPANGILVVHNPFHGKPALQSRPHIPERGVHAASACASTSTSQSNSTPIRVWASQRLEGRAPNFEDVAVELTLAELKARVKGDRN